MRTYSRATIGKTVHPTATLAKSPMPSGAKAADVDLTFSLILEDGWSLDLTCNSAPGHHLAVRGFELARKHHMQEGHKGHNPRQSKRKDASGMAKATAALHNAHLLYAETKHGSPCPRAELTRRSTGTHTALLKLPTPPGGVTAGGLVPTATSPVRQETVSCTL